MQPIHERMPVIIPKTHYRQWLDSRQTPASLQQLLADDGYATMTIKPVSDWVNNPQHNDRNCLNERY